MQNKAEAFFSEEKKQKTFSLAVAGLILCLAQHARAEHVMVQGSVARFSSTELGGIRTILRFEDAQPDRREIDYLLLGDPADATSNGLPQRIQVIGPHGRAQLLADVDGADCALQRFAIVRSGGKVALLTAEWAGDPAAPGGIAVPAPFDIQVYERQDGGDPGESSPIFLVTGKAQRVGPLCTPRTSIAPSAQWPAAVCS